MFYKISPPFFRRAGFTLTELIVVVVIIVLLTGYLILGFSFLSPKEVEKETEKLVGDLLWIRELANCGVDAYLVTFDTINDRYALYKNSPHPNNLITPPCSLKADLTSAPPQIIFGNYGKLQGTTTFQIIQLRKGNRRRTITVYPNTGAIEW